LTDLGVDVI